MVATTRASAARRQQSSNAEDTNVLGGISKKDGKKKKKSLEQSGTSSITSSSVQSQTTISPTPTSSSLTAPSSPTHLVTTLTTTPTSTSTFKLSDHLNNNYANGIDENDQRIDLPPVKLDQNSNTSQDEPCDFDDNEELDTIISWPIIIGETEWCKTNRGNDRMCMGGYTYDFINRSLRKNSRNFRCSKKDIGCRVVVQMFIASSGYKGSNNAEHNHPPNHHTVKRLLVLQKVKERVMMEPTSVTRIIEDEYVKSRLNDGDHRHFLLPTAQASKFYKIRAKMLPPNPKSMDFEVPASYSTTHNGEEFLIYDSTHKKLGGRLMMFSTEVLIKMLCSCDVILIDGTFKTRPTMFSQVYVIMGQHLDEAIPLVWCLTPKRTQAVYEKIFKVLKRKSMDHGLNFEPKYAYLDFEVGTINALENIFPNISIHGCWYHFTQTLYRNIQTIGLTSMYDANEEVKTWLKSFMALPLIKNSVVHAAIDLLIENVPSSDKLLVEFYEYFQQQWLKRIPPKYWNLGPIHLRCNNSVEGYNNRLQHRFGIHPQLWSFIHFLKGEEALVKMRTSQIRAGTYRDKAIPFSFGNERSRKKTKQLKNLSRLFQIGTIDLHQYITNLSYFVGESATMKRKKNDDNCSAPVVADNHGVDNNNI